MGTDPEIVMVERRLDRAELARLVQLYFGDMVKYEFARSPSP